MKYILCILSGALSYNAEQLIKTQHTVLVLSKIEKNNRNSNRTEPFFKVLQYLRTVHIV